MACRTNSRSKVVLKTVKGLIVKTLNRSTATPERIFSLVRCFPAPLLTGKSILNGTDLNSGVMDCSSGQNFIPAVAGARRWSVRTIIRGEEKRSAAASGSFGYHRVPMTISETGARRPEVRFCNTTEASSAYRTVINSMFSAVSYRQS